MDSFCSASTDFENFNNRVNNGTNEVGAVNEKIEKKAFRQLGLIEYNKLFCPKS